MPSNTESSLDCTVIKRNMHIIGIGLRRRGGCRNSCRLPDYIGVECEPRRCSDSARLPRPRDDSSAIRYERFNRCHDFHLCCRRLGRVAGMGRLLERLRPRHPSSISGVLETAVSRRPTAAGVVRSAVRSGGQVIIGVDRLVGVVRVRRVMRHRQAGSTTILRR